MCTVVCEALDEGGVFVLDVRDHPLRAHLEVGAHEGLQRGSLGHVAVRGFSHDKFMVLEEFGQGGFRVGWSARFCVGHHELEVSLAEFPEATDRLELLFFDLALE